MELCKKCEGAGMRIVERPDGTNVARRCECQDTQRQSRLLASAKIPQRYTRCTFDEYYPGKNPSLQNALAQARAYVNEYPIGTDGKGLLFTGPNGTGKTHLAVGITHALVSRGFQCLFVTYGELLKQVQNTYNSAVQETELDILRPVFETEVLIIDELGSSKPTDWVWDTVAHILNTRYNEMRSTIITTNYVNSRELLDGDIPEVLGAERDAWLAMYKETLGDRIGERMRSRLQEMCVVIEVTGNDFRTKVKRHSNVPAKVRSASTVPREPAVPPVNVEETFEEPPVVGPARMGRHAARRDVSGRN